MYKFTDMKSGIDLRVEEKRLIEEFGFDALYIRNCKFVRCSCFDDLNKTGDPNCPLCFGSGYFASIEKIKTIESSNSAYSSTNTIINTDIGQTEQKNEIYYINYDLSPKARDFILKVTWDKFGNPIDIIQVLEIVGKYEMRGDKGRVELYGCIVNDRTDLVKTFDKVLRLLPKKGLAQLLRGGKYIWPQKMLN